MDERRHYERFDTLNFVYYVLQDNDSILTQDIGRTLDASAEGLLIQTHEPLVAGLRLQLSLALADELLEARGTVIHVGAEQDGFYRSGVRLDDLDAHQQAQYQRFLQGFIAA